MNTPTSDDRVQSTEKTSKDEMSYEICDFAHSLRTGVSPLDVVQALIDGTLAFAGRIGENAMRHYISDVDQINFISQQHRRSDEKKNHDDDPLPF